MRRPFTLVSLAVLLVSAAPSALAQKKSGGAKKPSAASTWVDPVTQEKSDRGPFAPHKDEATEAETGPRPARAPDRGRSREKIVAFGQILIGFGRAPENRPDYAPGAKGTAIGFLLGGRYDVSKLVSLGLRIPFTTATVKQPDGTHLSSSVFGSPELFGEYRLSLDRLTTVPIAFGVGIPLAQGNPDETGTDTTGHARGYANRLADATSGWRDSELFQPKRLPIVVGAGIHHDRRDWELHGDAKLVLMPALSTTVRVPSVGPPNSGTYKLTAFALREVTTLGGSYNFLSQPLIYAGLDLAIVWSPVQTWEFDREGDDNRPTTLQAVLEPRVGARFGAVSPSVGYVAPLGGRLGEADVGGVRLRVDAFF